MTYFGDVSNTEQYLYRDDIEGEVASLRADIELLGDEDVGLREDLENDVRVLEELLSDVSRGDTLIHDAAFVDYAEETAYSIGAISQDLDWPVCHIDWEAAAESLKMDYIPVNFAGETFWVRA